MDSGKLYCPVWIYSICSADIFFYRQTYWTYTVGNDETLLNQMVAIYQDEVNKINTIPGLVPSAVYQLITKDMTSQMAKNGGNPLGLYGTKGALNRTFSSQYHHCPILI